MTAASASVLAGTQAPTLEVRNLAGDLVGRVSLDHADELIAAGLVSPVGRNRIKYLLFTRREPALARAWRGGSHTTERIRNEQGIVIGPPKSGLQHRELPREN